MTITHCPDCRTEYSASEEFCSDCGGLLKTRLEAPTTELPEQRITEKQSNELPSASSSNTPAELLPQTKAIDSTRMRIKHKLDQYFGASESRSLKLEQSVDADKDPLPLHERQDNGWQIAGSPIRTHKGFVEWPVSKQTEQGLVEGIYRRYTTGVLSTAQIYDQLRTTNSASAFSQLMSNGTVCIAGGARADYEINLKPVGQPLNVWLKQTSPGLERTLFLANAILRWLPQLIELGLQPATVDPSMLYITNDGVVSLAVLGGLTACNDTDQYNADLINSALLTLPYCAPELLGRRVIASNSVCFGVGQILTESLYGEARDHTYVQDGGLSFKDVEDVRLQAILMGCLYPIAAERWSADELFKAFQQGNVYRTPPWGRLQPGAATSAFLLGGEAFYLVEDLLAVVVKHHWDEGLLRFEEILAWLEATRFKGQLRLARQAKANGRSTEWCLLHLVRTVLPDAPLVWRGLALDDDVAQDSLIYLAQQALSEGNESLDAQMLVQMLFESDLKSAFSVNKHNGG